MFLTNILYSKVIHQKSEADWSGVVAPEAGCCFALAAAVLLQPFFKELLGDKAGTR